MASYNELNALIDAYINRNGVHAITGQILNGVLKAMVEQLGRGYTIMGYAEPTGDPGTPDGPETWFASIPGTYTNFGEIQVAAGELALLSFVPSEGWAKNTIYEGFQTVQATIDGNVGTPEVGVSYANGVLSFDFHNMKGNPGEDGNDGAPAGFGTIAATVDGNIGTPGVTVQSSGPDTAKNLTFAFTNLKGETGVTSVVATVDNTSGNPQCTVSLQNGQLTLAFTGLKGAQGDTGSSVDYPFTIVNNLTTNDPTQALSAAMGVQLEAEVRQLEAEMGEEISESFQPGGVGYQTLVDNNIALIYGEGGHVINGYGVYVAYGGAHLFATPGFIPVYKGVQYSLNVYADLSNGSCAFYSEANEESFIRYFANTGQNTITFERNGFIRVTNNSLRIANNDTFFKAVIDTNTYNTLKEIKNELDSLNVEENIEQLRYEIGNVKDIYTFIPKDGEGTGYYNDDLEVSANPDYRRYVMDVSEYAGKRVRLRAGNSIDLAHFTYFCHIKNSDNSIIHLYGNQTIVSYIKEYALVKLPENASELYLSWDKTFANPIRPMFAYEPLEDMVANFSEGFETSMEQLPYKFGNVNDIYTPIPEDGEGTGYYDDNLTAVRMPDYRRYVMDVSEFAGKRVRLRAGNSIDLAHFTYFCHIKNSDNSIIHLYGNQTIVSYIKGYALVKLPENASELYLSWDKTFANPIRPMFAYEPLDDEVMNVSEGLNIRNNAPVLPSQIFLQSDKLIPIYKNSLLINPFEASKIDINIIAESASGFTRKIYELNEPTYFGNNDFAGTAKIFLQRVDDIQNLYFKDVKVFHKDVSGLNGRTVKILSLGDSLTQGLGWGDTPVTMLAQALEEYGVSVQYIGTLVRTYINNHGQSVQIRYEGRGGWRYRTFVGMESKFVDYNVIIPSETTHEWIEGVDGTINEIKANNAWLYPATEQDLAENPNYCFHFVPGSTVANKSYAEDPTLETYYIFDPVRYFSERNIDVPDIVTIALGTNEWYLGQSFYGGFDNAKATGCAEFMFKQFRKVSANLKIVVIPLNNFPITRQKDWENYCMPLCSNVIRVCDNIISNGDTNLFICPTYANGSRWLGYNGTIGSATDVSEINDMKKIGMDNNVHMLYVRDDSNNDYIDSLLACIINLL